MNSFNSHFFGFGSVGWHHLKGKHCLLHFSTSLFFFIYVFDVMLMRLFVAISVSLFGIFKIIVLEFMRRHMLPWAELDRILFFNCIILVPFSRTYCIHKTKAQIFFVIHLHLIFSESISKKNEYVIKSYNLLSITSVLHLKVLHKEDKWFIFVDTIRWGFQCDKVKCGNRSELSVENVNNLHEHFSNRFNNAKWLQNI